MLKDVVSAVYKEEYQIEITFEDGYQQVIWSPLRCKRALSKERIPCLASLSPASGSRSRA